MIFKFFMLYIFLIFPANALDNGFNTSVTTLTVADVAQTITSSIVLSYDFVIQNPTTSSASVFIGDSDVATSGDNLGIEIVPGESFSIISRVGGLLSSSKVFIVSPVNGIPVVVGNIGK